jgi:uncharacterized membrane protein
MSAVRVRCRQLTVIRVAFAVLGAAGAIASPVLGSQSAAAQSTSMIAAPAAPTAALGDSAALRRNGNEIGIRAHGFLGDTSSGPFTRIDARGASFFTVVFGIENDGRSVGGYVDTEGRLHGFLRAPGNGLKPIDVPGARHSLASRINAQGQIVGAYSNERFVPALEMTHGFLLDNGVFTKIDVPGARRTQPFGINNHGQIVGEYVDGGGKTHGFLRHRGHITTLDVPGSTATFAYDIDDDGRIAGFSLDATGTFHGFLRDAQGAFTTIDAPGAARGTLPFGLNNRGQVVGFYLELVDDVLQARAFVLENGRFTTVDVPDATVDTTLFDINDNGQLAGVYDLVQHGFLRERRGDFTTIDPPDGGSVNEIVGINNRGQIVGRYVDRDNRNHGFLKDQRGFVSLDFPGATATATYHINDRGQIVGAYSTVSNNTGYPTHGYVLDAGAYTTIDVPGAQHTNALDINNRGQIVGEYQDASGAFHGYLRDRSGAFTTVDVPGAARTLVNSINDRGQMVGQFIGAAGDVHGFLLDQEVVTVIDSPDGAIAGPVAINNHGDIVGITFDGVRGHGFLLEDGVFTRITPAGEFIPYVIGVFVTDIDDRGRIAGAAL